MIQRCLIAAACLAMPAQVAANEQEQVPQIGLDGPELDACGGIGSVTHFEPEIAVLEAPDIYAREKDRLPLRTLVWLCEAVGDYQGIVYATGEFQDLGDCRVSRPIAAPQAYDGPGATGWVMALNLSLVSE